MDTKFKIHIHDSFSCIRNPKYIYMTYYHAYASASRPAQKTPRTKFRAVKINIILNKFSEQTDNFTEDDNVIEVDWFHRSVFRLQAVVAFFFIEAFNSCFVVFCHSDDNFTVVRDVLFAHDDPVAVVYTGINHTVASDIQEENFTVMICRKEYGMTEVIVDVFYGVSRKTSCNFTEHRHMNDR